jgi:hypothetical protein
MISHHERMCCHHEVAVATEGSALRRNSYPHPGLQPTRVPHPRPRQRARVGRKLLPFHQRRLFPHPALSERSESNETAYFRETLLFLFVIPTAAAVSAAERSDLLFSATHTHASATTAPWPPFCLLLITYYLLLITVHAKLSTNH